MKIFREFNLAAYIYYMQIVILNINSISCHCKICKNLIIMGFKLIKFAISKIYFYQNRTSRTIFIGVTKLGEAVYV